MNIGYRIGAPDMVVTRRAATGEGDTPRGPLPAAVPSCGDGAGGGIGCRPLATTGEAEVLASAANEAGVTTPWWAPKEEMESPSVL